MDVTDSTDLVHMSLNTVANVGNISHKTYQSFLQRNKSRNQNAISLYYIIGMNVITKTFNNHVKKYLAVKLYNFATHIHVCTNQCYVGVLVKHSSY